MKTVGCVIVSYNVPEIVTRAVNSIRDYVDEVLIIDHSKGHNPAYKEADSLGVSVKHTHKNTGHGPGMDMGLRMIETDYVIVMDSDVVVKDGSIVKDMKAILDNDDKVYGVGEISPNVSKWVKAPYLHPYFAMIRRDVYLKHEPFIHQAAPTGKAMRSIKGKMKVVNIDMSRVWHEHRRTRERGEKNK
jgi:GT2 family glycosyltransferase